MPVQRQKDKCVLRKVHIIRLHFRQDPWKNIFPYYYPGLVQPWIRSWIATLSQSILIRCAFSFYGSKHRQKTSGTCPVRLRHF